MIVRPLYFLPMTRTPSTYLPGLTLIVVVLLVLPALSTAFWIVRYLQPCLQTSPFSGFFLATAEPAEDEDGYESKRRPQKPSTPNHP